MSTPMMDIKVHINTPVQKSPKVNTIIYIMHKDEDDWWHCVKNISQPSYYYALMELVSFLLKLQLGTTEKN